MPGAGSLAAGRVSGYAQLALAIGGMALTMFFGVRFLLWYVANWTRFHGGSEIDPMNALGEMWVVLRWAVMGIVVFLGGWLWALVTGLQIVNCARKTESAAVPPRLDRNQLRYSPPINSGGTPLERRQDKPE